LIPFRDTIYILFGSFIYISDIVIEVMLNLQTLMLALFVALGAVLVTGLIAMPAMEEVDATKKNIVYCGSGGCFESKKECKENSDTKCEKMTGHSGGGD
jgi:hypothetical protein